MASSRGGDGGDDGDGGVAGKLWARCVTFGSELFASLRGKLGNPDDCRLLYFTEFNLKGRDLSDRGVF
jgi:hypothetical protein